MARKLRTSNYLKKKSGVYATPVAFVPATSGVTRASVMAAAAVFAAQAQRNASFSKRIPLATGVIPTTEQAATVITVGNIAPNAAPFEFGERHPVYGRSDRARSSWTWRKMQQRAYMSRAALNPATIDTAASAYQNIEVDLIAVEKGFDE